MKTETYLRTKNGQSKAFYQNFKGNHVSEDAIYLVGLSSRLRPGTTPWTIQQALSYLIEWHIHLTTDDENTCPQDYFAGINFTRFRHGNSHLATARVLIKMAA